jgi:hypothetical protein
MVRLACKWWHCDNDRDATTAFCSRSCANKFAVDQRRRKVKVMLVQRAGGKCMRCGYDRCIAALEFHHRDPSGKAFALALKGETKSFERLCAEADKCDLLCANCHREVEAEPFAARWELVAELIEQEKAYG